MRNILSHMLWQLQWNILQPQWQPRWQHYYSPIYYAKPNIPILQNENKLSATEH